MNVFIDILINDRYYLLFRFFRLPNYFFKKTWDRIFDEYTSLIKTDDSNASFELMKDITFLRNKIYIIEVAVYALRLKYNEKAASLLRRLGYDFKYREDTYIQDCERVLKRSKSLVAELKKKEGEFSKMKRSGSVSESDFNDILFSISKYSGVLMSPKHITVAEFCSAYNQYYKHVKSSENGERRKD